MTIKYKKGFTLIEMIVVLVIIGILLAMAYPSYLSSIRKTRRAEALIAVESMAQAQERFFSQFRTYTSVVAGADGCVGQACGLNMGSTSTENNYYALTSNGDATSYTVTALAQNQQFEDDDCRTFTLNNASVKAAASASSNDTTDNCW